MLNCFVGVVAGEPIGVMPAGEETSGEAAPGDDRLTALLLVAPDPLLLVSGSAVV